MRSLCSEKPRVRLQLVHNSYPTTLTRVVIVLTVLAGVSQHYKASASSSSDFSFLFPQPNILLAFQAKQLCPFHPIILPLPKVSYRTFYAIPSRTPKWPKPPLPRRLPSPLLPKALPARPQSPRTPTSTRTSSFFGLVSRLQTFR